TPGADGLLLLGHRLLGLLPAHADGALGAAAGAGGGARALAAHGQGAAVADPAVGADLDQALDVHGDLAPEVTLDQDLLGAGEAIDDLAEAPHLLVRQVLDPAVRVDVGDAQD